VKIDDYQSDILSNQPLDPVARPTQTVGNPDNAGLSPALGSRGTDRVQLSDDVQLMRAGAEAVRRMPDVRPDVVARMRAALDRGEIGNNPQQLADALIDSWLALAPGKP
jgi:flagellar biosynthesis anti-sigma factor FlgM